MRHATKIVLTPTWCHTKVVSLPLTDLRALAAGELSAIDTQKGYLMTKERACANGSTMSRRTLLSALPASGALLMLPSIASAAEEIEAPHPVLSLPFVRDTSRAEQRAGLPPRLFWNVEPSGDYSADCETGAHYARLALDYMTKDSFSGLLGWAVFDMMRPGPAHSGIEVGFLSVFGRHAMVANMLISEHQKAPTA